MTAIIGIKIQDRASEAHKLQDILTLYGCEIRTRLGLHEIGEYKCNNFGLVIIEVVAKVNEIYDELAKHWQIEIMKF